MNLRVIESKTDVRETLTECLGMADGLTGVIVLGLTKESTQVLRTSTMSALEKSFLTTFLNAWMTKWFHLENSP